MQKVYKVILLGDAGVGKTAIVNMQVNSSFDTLIAPTVSPGSFQTMVPVDGQFVKLTLWDTAGQERYRSLTSAFIRNSVVAILVADVKNQESIENIDLWAKELEICEVPPQIIVAVNKSDLTYNDPTILAHALTQLSRKYENVIDVSALTGSNIDKLFSLTAEFALESSLMNPANAEEKKEKSSCC